MRKVLLSLAAAGTALIIASPAAAQYYPQQRGAPYGNAYGYNGYRNGNYNNYGAVRTLQSRLNNVMRSLGGVRPDRAEQIRGEAFQLDRRLRMAARNGLNPYEAQNLDRQVNRLELQLQYASNRGYRRDGYGNYNGYNGYDRDSDGRDDRYEDDHGRRHDR
jgi:hypothetical protein